MHIFTKLQKYFTHVISSLVMKDISLLMHIIICLGLFLPDSTNAVYHCNSKACTKKIMFFDQ